MLMLSSLFNGFIFLRNPNAFTTAFCILRCHVKMLSRKFGGGTCFAFKEVLYRIWCGVNRLGDSDVNRLGDTSAFVNPAVKFSYC